MSLSDRPQRGTVLASLLCLLTITCVLCSCCVQASVTDRFPDIANAFARDTLSGTVRAVYDGAQLTETATAGSTTLNPFQSSSYALCLTTTPPTATITTDADTAATIKLWCSSSNNEFGGRLVAQTVNWSTLAAPGLQALDTSTTTYRALAWDCLTFACDTESMISTSTWTAPAVVGGLSVAAPCCGSTNGTFILYNTRGVVVQADALPVTALNSEAADLAAAYAASSAAATLFAGAMDFCLIRQLLPSFIGDDVEGTREGSVGDGGILVSVDVAVCSQDLSDRIDTRDATLAMTGFHMVLVTADGVDELSFPTELINSIMSWIAVGAGSADGTYNADQSLGRAGGVCVWHRNAVYQTAYRTGEYCECTFADASLLDHLPPLLLTVRNESIVDTEQTNSSCSIAIDLTACALSSGLALRFFSTGSLTQELRLRDNAMAAFRDPPIVVGVRHLRGATVAVTRTAVVDKWFSSGYNLGAGLPLLYLAVPRGTAIVESVSSTSWYACVRPQTCLKRQVFYPSLNRCATKECVNVFLYHFDPETFSCTVQVSIVSLFAAMCAALLLAELVVLYLRRSTEQAKDEHMRLVHAVQRREAGTQ